MKKDEALSKAKNERLVDDEKKKKVLSKVRREREMSELSKKLYPSNSL